MTGKQDPDSGLVRKSLFEIPPSGRRKLLSSSVLSQDRGKLGVTLEDPLLPDPKGEFAGSSLFFFNLPSPYIRVCSEVFCGLFFPSSYPAGPPGEVGRLAGTARLRPPVLVVSKKKEDGGQPRPPPNGPGKMSASSFSLSLSLRPPSS